MSSRTTLRAVPQKPPDPPVFSNSVSGVQATCPSNLFGQQGCAMIRDTLAALAGGTAPVLAGLPTDVAADSPLDALRGWRADPADKNRFFKTIRDHEVEVRVGVALQTGFHFKVETTGVRLSEEERLSQAQVFQSHVNRTVNTVIALAASQWIGQKVEQKLSPLVKNTIRQKTLVANHGTNSVVRNQFTGFSVQGR
jgi:hypothetical protein